MGGREVGGKKTNETKVYALMMPAWVHFFPVVQLYGLDADAFHASSSMHGSPRPFSTVDVPPWEPLATCFSWPATVDPSAWSSVSGSSTEVSFSTSVKGVGAPSVPGDAGPGGLDMARRKSKETSHSTQKRNCYFSLHDSSSITCSLSGHSVLSPERFRHRTSPSMP